MANERRKCELYVVRVVPHALRGDAMTVGLVVVEPGGEFAEVRLTRDWKRVECFAPDLELEIFEYLETTIRAGLKEIKRREDLTLLLEERFGALFEVEAPKALVAVDPAAEMRILERDYLAAMQPAERARRMGRLGIVSRMQDAFAQAGVLEMLQRDIEMTEYTGENDPFRVDFGFRVGKALKMFHGLALNLSREPAVTLAYRYGRMQDGLRKRGEEALLTAVISEEAMRGIPPNENRVGWGTGRTRGEVASGIGMLMASEIRVRAVEEMPEIAEEVRREVAGS